MAVSEEKIEQVARRLADAERVVVFCGAGISTESGIPDFRSPGGVWDKYNPEDFYFDNFISNERSREKYWQMATEIYAPMKKAVPNAAHLAIVELEKMEKLDCVITQNIDGLHHRAGNSGKKIIELHGTALYVTCLSCHKHYDRDEIQTRIASGTKVPYCDDCRGILKPATISFGQAMPQQEMDNACNFTCRSDIFIVIGSSLIVYPAASLPYMAKKAGSTLVIINRDPTPCDEIADTVIQGAAGQVMADILNHLKKLLKK